MSRVNRRHRAVARLIVALAGGLAIGLTIGGGAEQPAWLGVVAATLLVMLLIGAYELSVALLTRALGRVLPRGEAPELSEEIPPTRPRAWDQIRAPQALALLGAYLAGQLFIWIIVVVIALFRAGDPADSAAVQREVLRLAPAGLIFSVLASGLSVFALYRRKMGPAAMSAAGRELGWGAVTPAHIVVGFLLGLAIVGAPTAARQNGLTIQLSSATLPVGASLDPPPAHRRLGQVIARWRRRKVGRKPMPRQARSASRLVERQSVAIER